MSLNLFSPTNRLRVACFKIVTAFWFEAFVTTLIVANCVLLALEHPGLDPSVQRALSATDIAFAVAFTLEMVMKVVALGLYFTGDHAYLSNQWNWLDVTVVVLSWVALAVPGAAVGRAIRAVRPLRVIVRSRQIQVRRLRDVAGRVCAVPYVRARCCCSHEWFHTTVADATVADATVADATDAPPSRVRVPGRRVSAGPRAARHRERHRACVHHLAHLRHSRRVYLRRQAAVVQQPRHPYAGTGT